MATDNPSTTEVSPEAIVFARMREMVDHRSPWHRGLWQVGTLLTLREVIEYAEGVRSGICKAEGLAFVAASAHGLVERDPGLGSGEVKQQILRTLAELKAVPSKSNQVKDSLDATLQQILHRLDRTYLNTWLDAIKGGAVEHQNAELAARLLVAHLLDSGFSPDHIHGWLLAMERRYVGGAKQCRDRESDRVHLSSLVSRAKNMYSDGVRRYHVYVCFSSIPEQLLRSARLQGRYLAHQDLIRRCEENEWTLPPFPETRPGVIKFVVDAREPKSAISAAEIEVRRLIARVGVGLKDAEIILESQALVHVEPAEEGATYAPAKWHAFSPRPHHFLLTSIQRHSLLLPENRASTSRSLDDAVELLANAETTTSWTAVGSIWAAVEGLLGKPGEAGVMAADRMASIVAGGYARAELTTLVDRFAGAQTALGIELGNKQTSLTSRFRALLQAIDTDTLPPFEDPTTAAALLRLRTLRDDPRATLARVRHYYRDAFRRLYMQRNLLLHGGRFDSIALPATTRTIPPLVAAGLDRIIHAALQTPITSPIELAARADFELSIVGGDEGRAIHHLLD